MRRALIGAVLATAAVCVAWGGRSLAPRLLTLVAGVHSLGAAAPIVFVAAYAAAVVALVPASLLTVAAGALFGLMRGVAYAFGGAVIGSTAAFLIGRHFARHIVARRLDAMPRFAAIDRAVSARGRQFVFLLRLSPVIPFNFLNYALGLTTITLGDFVLASPGMVPATIVYAYAGKVAGEAVALAGRAQVARDAAYYLVLLSGLAAAIAAAALVTRTARRALRDV